MKKISQWVGLDVHAETIAVAVADKSGDVRSIGTFPNRAESLRKLLKKLGGPEGVAFCYEAGPTGYAVYWELTRQGAECQVIAPSLIPQKAGDRVKTDRRDAEKLARAFRSGDLTAVWVPDPAHEALRDLVRAREVAKADELRARNRLSKFLLRLGLRPPEKTKAWTQKHLQWLRNLKLEHMAQELTRQDYLGEVDHAVERILRLEKALDEAVAQAPEKMKFVIAALQGLRGVAKLTAVSAVAEVGEFSRFTSGPRFMGYGGIVPSEHSSGGRTQRGQITKTGNAHLRRLVVESAWAYSHLPRMYPALRKRQEGLDEEVKAISMKAQHRLSGRLRKLVARGKPKPLAITAVARELLGFMWAVGCHAEKSFDAKTKKAA